MLDMDRQPFCFSLSLSGNHFIVLPRFDASIYKKDISIRYVLFNSFEPKAGLEPATYSLRMNCSTN